MPSFADRLDAPLEVQGLGALKVDVAYGGDSFVIVDAAALGFAIEPDEARDLAELGVRIIAAANAQFGFSHPERSGWEPHLLLPVRRPAQPARETNFSGPNAVVVRPGKIDRSPTGTGCSARMATLSARGLMARGRRLSRPLDHRLRVRLPHRAARLAVGGRPAIVPIISGRAWITGISQYMLDPADPWPAGYRLADTWPRR